jgi:hypothetical protein
MFATRTSVCVKYPVNAGWVGDANIASLRDDTFVKKP